MIPLCTRTRRSLFLLGHGIGEKYKLRWAECQPAQRYATARLLAVRRAGTHVAVLFHNLKPISNPRAAEYQGARQRVALYLQRQRASNAAGHRKHLCACTTPANNGCYQSRLLGCTMLCTGIGAWPSMPPPPLPQRTCSTPVIPWRGGLVS